jgi:hypothetical protein
MCKRCCIFSEYIAIVLFSLIVPRVTSLQAQVTYYEANIGWGLSAVAKVYYDGAPETDLLGEMRVTFPKGNSPPGYGAFTSYCIDMVDPIPVPTTFYTTPTTFSQSGLMSSWQSGGIQRAAWLYNTISDDVTTGVQAAALQIAIYNVLYNSGWNTGRITMSPANTQEQTIFNQAQSWAATAWSLDINSLHYTKTFWSARQNAGGGGAVYQGLIGPVPEPNQYGLGAVLVLGSWASVEVLKRNRTKKRC